jgi:hypothetical protein
MNQETLVPAGEAKSGEPVILQVTVECNGHAVFVLDDYKGVQLVKWFWGRDQAIRWAITDARKEAIVYNTIAAEKKGGAS